MVDRWSTRRWGFPCRSQTAPWGRGGRFRLSTLGPRTSGRLKVALVVNLVVLTLTDGCLCVERRCLAACLAFRWTKRQRHSTVLPWSSKSIHAPPPRLKRSRGCLGAVDVKNFCAAIDDLLPSSMKLFTDESTIPSKAAVWHSRSRPQITAGPSLNFGGSLG